MVSRRRVLGELVVVGVGGVLASCARAAVPEPTVTPEPAARAVPTAAPVPTAALARQPTVVVRATPPQQATVTPAPVADAGPAAAPRVLPGIDVLVREQIDVLRARRLGLVTNATGRDAQGRSTIDLLHAEPAWQLTTLFSPEHGIRGEAEAGASVASSQDTQTGLPIHSLYGETTRPTPAMLGEVDTLVFDIQDVGARVYTYIATLLEVMRAGAQHGLPVVVLDRPNVVGGQDVEGNVLDPRFTSFVGPAPIAMRFGMTIGELGRWFNGHMAVGADLTVVPLRGWQRDAWYDQTGLAWINPSPNLRSVTAAGLYPGTVLFEGTNFSEGRGTDRPFEWVGAPFVDGAAWAERLRRAAPPGVTFEPATRTPSGSKHAGQTCEGVLVAIVDRAQLRPMELGLVMLATARETAGARFAFSASQFDRLAGTDQVRLALEAGRSVREIVANWQPALEAFTHSRASALLY